ncbi:MAG: TatD family hydrolase [bacterium]|nr:TatD family hydrolase [bacterium]
MLIDTHLHLALEDYDIAEVIRNAKKNDVNYLILGSSSRDDNVLNVDLSLRYENIFTTVGYHPSEAIRVSEDDLSFLRSVILQKKVVGIGEIGLDYHYGNEDRDFQISLFRKQLDIAQEYQVPVVIHTRDAFSDTYNILKDYKLKGIIHCFSGSLETAKMFIDLGYYLGIGGVIMFKNSKLKDVVKEIGISKIVFETDSPYLSPFRGEKNVPSNVRYICDFVADLLELDSNKVEKITSSNAMALFDLKL